jgi:UDP-glucuronate 4-epimerase
VKPRRDFTYIEDIIEGIVRVLDTPATPNLNWSSNNPDSATSSAPWRIYDIGNNNPVELMDYIKVFESALKKKTKLNLLPLQPGDVPDTYADIEDLVRDFKYQPSTKIDEGMREFVTWFKGYYS